MNTYAGADIENRDGNWWIVYDEGEKGPFQSYDAARIRADLHDDELPMENQM